MKTGKRIICTILCAAMLLSCLAVPTVAETPTNKSVVYAFLKSELDVNDAAICGIMANLQCESGFSPSAKYTEADGALSFGLCQWNKDRLEALKTFCKEKGYTYTTLTGQLYYLKHELQTSELSAFNKVRSVENTAEGAYTAGYNWARYFERCASSGYEKRAVLARDTYWPEYGAPVVQAGIISERIATLGEMLEGKYFTVNQKGCRVYERGHKCANCLSKTISEQKWFMDMFGSGIDPTRQFPRTYYSNGTTGSRYGWSCYGFAGFAEWYIFKNDNTDVVDVTYEGTYSFNYENCSKYIQTGDLLRLNDTHSAIAINATEEGLMVLDCNYVGDYNCMVSTHLLDYSVYSKVSISRAINSVEIRKYEFDYNANGGHIRGEDSLLYHYTVVSTNGLNMRSGPGTSYGRLVALPYRTIVTVTDFAEADGYTWGRATYNGSTGWIVVSEAWTTCEIEHVSAYYLDENGAILSGATDKAVSTAMVAGVVDKSGLVSPDTFGLYQTDAAFLGWSPTPDGTAIFPAGGSIIPDELVVNAPDASGTITLYAIWDNMVIPDPPLDECKHPGMTAVVTAPTYTEKGYTTYTCPDCGYTAVGDEVPATGHSFQAVVTDPTCEDEGFTTKTCTVCGAVEITDRKPANGHSYSHFVVPPTCTAQGYTVSNCTACGKSTVGDWIAPLGHDYVSDVVAPTCLTEGHTDHICSRCGDSYTDAVTPIAAHTYVDTVVAPTCTAEGYTEHVCSHCGDTYRDTPTPFAAHTYVDTVVAPTREAQGYTEHTCSVCHHTYTDSYTEKLPTLYYTVRYDANGGTGTMADQSFIVDEDGQLTACAFVRSGFTFAGWEADGKTFTDAQRVKNLSTVEGSVVTLRATWRVNTYRAVFDANGGTGTMDPVSLTYGQYAVLPESRFTRPGYIFLGWSGQKDAKSARYPAGSLVWNLTGTDGADVTLYAVWDRADYRLKFNANGGRGTMADVPFGVLTPVTLPATAFYRSGYTFVGWATTPDGAPVYSDSTYIGVQNEHGFVAGIAKELTLYAVWKLNTYTVHFEANGGTGEMADAVLAFGSYERLPANAFTRDSYTFAGWAIRSDETTSSGRVRYADRQLVWNLASLDGASVTLTAVWTAN